MNLKALPVIVYIVILSAASADAQEPYLYDGTRPLSMGKAFTALANDENTLFYNPAGLTRIEGHRLSLSGYIQQYAYEATSTMFEGWAPNFTDRGYSVSYAQHRFGISYSMTGKGWWESPDYEGRYIYMPEGPPPSSRRVNYEHYLTASYAHEILPWLDLGLTGKYLHFSPHLDSERLEDRDGFTFDLGLLLYPADRLSIGLTLLNAFSSEINYFVYSDYTSVAYLSELPVNLAVGIAWLPIDALTITADARNILQDDVKSAFNDYDLEFKSSYHFGLEWRPTADFALRGGYYWCERPVKRIYMGGVVFNTIYSYEYDSYNNFSLGAGYSYKGFSFDLGVKLDDRSSKMNESTTSQVRGTTALGSASASYSF
jgi:hypothetical protein